MILNKFPKYLTVKRFHLRRALQVLILITLVALARPVFGIFNQPNLGGEGVSVVEPVVTGVASAVSVGLSLDSMPTGLNLPELSATAVLVQRLDEVRPVFAYL